MLDHYLTGPFAPFTVALALLFGLLALELALAFIGGTLLGAGGDADLDLEVDIDGPDIGELGVDFGDLDADLLDFAEPEVDVAPSASSSVAANSPVNWIGIGEMPLMIWFAALLLGFGASGIALQSIVNAMIGSALPASLIVLPASFAGVWFAKSLGGVFARLLPRTKTTAVSSRHLGRRIGVITQGTARRGRPSEVKVSDRHGNTHYLRGEPLKDEDEIPAGTRVLVLRHRLQEGYRLIPLGPDRDK